jgi:hypothetical protein
MLLAALGDPMLALSWPPRGAPPGLFCSGFVFSSPVWRLLVAWGARLRGTCGAVVLGASIAVGFVSSDSFVPFFTFSLYES